MTEGSGLGIPHLTDERPIGRGGFSVVYAATDTRFDRRVAVKLLNPLTEDRDRRRFENECRVMGRVSDHPNVVTVHDAGFLPDNRPYLIMEHVEGGTLADRLQQGPLPWPEACRLMTEIAGALEHAHQGQVLHRDIKPANILLDADAGGVPKLTDFGIASLGGGTVSQTSTEISATWLHTAPETFNNQRDERSDVYSMASTLYHLIAGQAPHYRAEDTQVEPLLARLLLEPAPPLAAGLAPPAVDAFLARNLAKHPDERSQTAAAFGNEVRSLLAGAVGNTTRSVPAPGPVTPPPPSPSALTGTGDIPPTPPSPSGADTTEYTSDTTPLTPTNAAPPASPPPPAGQHVPSITGPRSTYTPPATAAAFPAAEPPAESKRSTVLILAGLAIASILGIGAAFVALNNAGEEPSGETTIASRSGSTTIAGDNDGRDSTTSLPTTTEATTTTAAPTTTTESTTTSTEGDPDEADGSDDSDGSDDLSASEVDGVRLESACVVPQVVPVRQPASAETSLDGRSCAGHSATFGAIGETHSYPIELDADDRITVQFDSNCSGVSFFLDGPLGEQFVEESAACLPETVIITAARPGLYTVRLEATNDGSQYDLWLLDVTDPSAQVPGEPVESSCPQVVPVPKLQPEALTVAYDDADCPSRGASLKVEGQVHRFVYALEAGDQVQVTIDQACGARATLSGPRGPLTESELSCFNRSTTVTAPITGDYHFDLTSTSAEADYQLQVLVPRPEPEADGG